MAGQAPCDRCARRSWLLNVLGVRLDFRSRDEARLLELLELEDEDLIDAIAGRRRREIGQAWKQFAAYETDTAPPWRRIETVCRHGPGYPKALRDQAGAPQMLYVLGGIERLAALTARAGVAIVGAAKPTDYGMEMARSLARGLTASGVTVLSPLAGEIAAATLAGARETGGPALAVMDSGLDTAVPEHRRGAYERLLDHGCAISELACGQPRHRWGAIAAKRTIAALARMTIVVEAGDDPAERGSARVANDLGRTVAAMPGRVSSPASTGTNLMLREGAPLVRDAADALELLSGLGTRTRGGWRPQTDSPPPAGAPTDPAAPEERKLEARLKVVLERIGGGRDTPGKLTGPGEDAGEIMLALAELEVMGLLSRGDGGRYVPRQSLPPRAGRRRENPALPRTGARRAGVPRASAPQT